MNPLLSKKYDFDIDATVNSYAGELALPYVTAAILGAETITQGRCRLIEGVVGEAVISGLGLADTIQSDSACGFVGGADLSLTEQVLAVNGLKVNEEICRKTIFPTWMAAQGRMNRNGDIPVSWTDFMLGAVAAKTGSNLENLLWQGSAAFTLGFLANDGTITEAQIDLSACKDFVEAQTSAAEWSAANILANLSTIFDAAQGVPGILQKPGCGFYVSYEAYAFYLQAMAAQNTGPGYNQSMEGATYLGYPVYPTPGIPNAVDVAVFTYPENLVVGTNAYTGNEEAALIPTYMYDGSDNVRVSMHFAVGVQTAVAGDGVVGFLFT